MPAVAMRQRGNQMLRIGGAKPRQVRLTEAVGDDAVDSSPLAAAGQVEMLLYDRRKAGGVFDDLAIDVDDVEIAVWRVCELRGPKPDVGRGHELPILVGAPGNEPHAVGFENLAVDDVASHVTDERLAAKFGG